MAQKPKRYRLTAAQIEPLATGFDAGLATDLLTVEGRPVGFMYREEPDHPDDSGWRFLAGTESPEYMDDPENLGAFDVNTIANFDPAIIPFLEAPVGSAFEREEGSDEFTEAPPPDLEDE